MYNKIVQRAAALSNNTTESTIGILTRVRTRVTIIVLGLLLIPAPVTAQETSELNCESLPEQFQAIEKFLTQVQETGVSLAFLLAAVLLVYVGLLWMTGSPAKQERARKIFINVFIGLIIVVLAAGLIEWAKTPLCGGV